MPGERVFIDTSAFYALVDRDDAHHVEATGGHRKLTSRAGRYESATSDYVLAETLTLVRMRRGHSIAVELGSRIRENALVSVLPITPELWEAAWDVFVKYADQHYSFTDCTSFVLMKAWKASQAFAYDDDFQTFGFASFS